MADRRPLKILKGGFRGHLEVGACLDDGHQHAKLGDADRKELPQPLTPVPYMVDALQAMQSGEHELASKAIAQGVGLSESPAMATRLGFLAIQAGNEKLARKAALRALQFAAVYPGARVRREWGAGDSDGKLTRPACGGRRPRRPGEAGDGGARRPGGPPPPPHPPPPPPGPGGGCFWQTPPPPPPRLATAGPGTPPPAAGSA